VRRLSRRPRLWGDGEKGGRGGDVHGASLGFGRERRVDLEGGGSKGDDSM
jgi:hypothetical protein